MGCPPQGKHKDPFSHGAVPQLALTDPGCATSRGASSWNPTGLTPAEAGMSARNLQIQAANFMGRGFYQTIPVAMVTPGPPSQPSLGRFSVFSDCDKCSSPTPGGSCSGTFPALPIPLGAAPPRCEGEGQVSNPAVLWPWQSCHQPQAQLSCDESQGVKHYTHQLRENPTGFS